MKKLEKIIKSLILILPGVLFLSYYPVIGLGSDETMNFEFSLPLIWLVVFDVLAGVMLVKKRVMFKWLLNWRWLWVLFPVWLTFSLAWSLNRARGIMVVGVLWLIYFAGYAIWNMRDLLDTGYRRKWWKWFFGATLLACVWCVVQCVLDLVGVSQDYSLICDGCTSRMFGFPHPNGLAIEPQFMGNLLLAPLILSVYMMLNGSRNSVLRGRGSSRLSSQGSAPSSLGRNLRKPLKTLFPAALVFIFASTLFLTFSRGAIYAFVVGLFVMSVMLLVRERKNVAKRVGIVWGLVVCAFVVVLNVQGLMAEVGPTSDTYGDGVAKVLNHLSLGIIDIRGGKNTNEQSGETGNTEGELIEDEFVLVENPVENSEKEEAIFDGYVTESTDVRVKLTGVALETWSQSQTNIMFGVGLGGAGVALYSNGLTSSPKEIVQNEYASLLLETGIVGVSLFILTLALVIRAIWNNPLRVMLIGLLAAYGISLFFFSGLPNALHIYLLPVVIYCSEKRK